MTTDIWENFAIYSRAHFVINKKLGRGLLKDLGLNDLCWLIRSVELWDCYYPTDDWCCVQNCVWWHHPQINDRLQTLEMSLRWWLWCCLHLWSGGKIQIICNIIVPYTDTFFSCFVWSLLRWMLMDRMSKNIQIFYRPLPCLFNMEIQNQ